MFVVFIIGVVGGLGWVIVKCFVQSYWCIVVMDVDKEGLYVLNVQVLLDVSGVVDLCSVDNCYILMLKIFVCIGCFDVLVNVVGVWCEGFVENFIEEDFDFVLGVNFKVFFYMCQVVIFYLKENQGSIVNIFSDFGCQVYWGLVVYCVSKVVLIMLSKILVLELVEQGVWVNVVLLVDIVMLMFDYQVECYGMGNLDGYKCVLLKDYLQGKVVCFICLEEVVELVWYFCGFQVEVIMGVDLVVDFGLFVGC